jgi:octaprenyl-diphosphate synthase
VVELSVPGRAERLLQDAAPTSAEIHDLVASRLDEVEALFRDNLASPVRIVREIGSFLAEGGGKRVRPTLHLLAADLVGYRGQNAVLLGAVLEYIHSATLIHDDIIDEAATRRGRPSVNRRWGNNLTVLFGDYLFAKAMQMALRAGSLRIMERLAEVTLRMAEGEMLQTRYAGRLDLTESEYLDLVERKTAALFACCCETAGILAEVDPERERALRRYGRHGGVGVQHVDVLHEVAGDAQRLGKPAGSDLREGKVTLALIDLLGSPGSARARTLARAVIEQGQPDSPELAELTAILRDSGALKRAQIRAQQHAAQAISELQFFPESPARLALAAVPDLLIFRDR